MAVIDGSGFTGSPYPGEQQMSYCRFGEADAYIIATIVGHLRGFDCCSCSLRYASGAEWRLFTSVAEILAHIAEHRDAGHVIPADVDEKIREDACWITDGIFAFEAQENSAEENR